MAGETCTACSRWREQAGEEQRKANREQRRADQYQLAYGELYAKVSSLVLWIQRQLREPRVPPGFLVQIQNRLKATIDQQ